MNKIFSTIILSVASLAIATSATAAPKNTHKHATKVVVVKTVAAKPAPKAHIKAKTVKKAHVKRVQQRASAKHVKRHNVKKVHYLAKR